MNNFTETVPPLNHTIKGRLEDDMKYVFKDTTTIAYEGIQNIKTDVTNANNYLGSTDSKKHTRCYVGNICHKSHKQMSKCL